MTVFVVVYHHYDDVEVEGVFVSLAQAETYCRSVGHGAACEIVEELLLGA